MSRESRQAVRAVFLAAIMVISVFAAGIAFSGSAAAQTDAQADLVVDDDFNNPDQDTNFSSIQNAVDNAAEDDIIAVRSGNYDESVTVDVSGLTIEAADGASPTVSPPESNGRTDTITISANGVTVQGLEIKATGGSTPRGIVLTGDDTSALNNSISHADSVADKSRTGPLIAVDGGDSVTVDGNTVTDGPIAYVGGSNNQVNFTNNTVEGDLVDEAFFAFGGTDPDLTFTGNDFSAADAGQDADVKFDLSSVAVNGQTDASSIVDTTQSSNTGAGVVEVDGDQFTDLETLFIRPGDDISAAIDSADSLAGVNTVQLADGTYDQSVTVDVEGLTLEAANGASPTLNSTGSKTVTLQGTDITIADLTITNSGGGNGIDIPSEQNASGLRLDGVTIANTSIAFFNDLPTGGAPDDNTEPDFTDVVFTDVTIENSERKGIYTEALSDAIFDGVIVDDVGSNNYGLNTGIDINLKYDDYQNVTIQNSVVSNVSEGDPFRDDPAFATGIGIKARDDPSSYDGNPATLDDVTVDNVTIEDSFNGLRIGEPGVDYSSAPQGPTDVTITDSTFQNNSGYHIEDVPGNLDLGDILNNQANEFDPVVTVEDDGGNITGNNIFGAIQPAVDAASAGDTVSVSSGTYEESVTITTENITLRGNNRPTIVGDGADEGSQPHATIHIDGNPAATNATIEGFTIQNPDGFYGIYAGTGGSNSDVDGLEVRDNVIENVATNRSSHSPLAGSVAGLYVRAEYDSITIEENIIRDVDTTGDQYQNAVGISLSSFIGNEAFAGGDDSGSETAEESRIRNNRITNITGAQSSRTKGISASGEFDGVYLRNNSITDITALTDDSDVLAISLTENPPTSNSDFDNDGTDERVGPQDFLIENNTIDQLDAGSTAAVFVGGYEELGFSEVRRNNILDGTVERFYSAEQKGADPDEGDLLRAPLNWWGNESGPNGASNTSVGSQVAYDPFLTTPIKNLAVDDVGDTRQFAQDVIAPAGQDVTAVGFPGPVPDGYTVGDAFEDTEGAVIYEYSQEEGSFVQVTGSKEISALDAFVIAQNSDTSDEDTQIVIEYAKDPADPGSPGIKTIEPGFNLISPRSLGDAYGAFDAPSDRETIYGTYGAPLERSESAFLGPADQDTNFIHTTFGPDQDDPVVTPYGGYLVFTQEERQITTFVQTGTTADEVINNLNQTAA